MKNHEKNTQSRIGISILLISVLLFFTLGSSLHVNAAYPRGKIGHNMAYDSTNDVIIVFGGTAQSATAYWGNETWVYDYNANEWTKMNPTGVAYGSMWAQIVYDSESDKVVAFGGYHAEHYPSNETWTYDYTTNTWTEASPNNVPRLRTSHTMAYDSESDVVIMYGGAGQSEDLNPFSLHRIGYNDTWAYNLNTDTWTNMTPSVTPLGRGSAEMAYDSESDRIIMFGGYHSATSSPFADPTGEVYQKETWAYDFNTNTWENVTPTFSPDPRMDHAMVYDSESDRIILFGGFTHLDSSGMVDETWVYDYNSNTWTKMNPTGSPERLAHQMAYDSESDLVILFGGVDSAQSSDYLAETWVYDFNTDTWTLIEIPTTPAKTNFYILSLIVSMSAISILKIRRRK